jgi:hypothetical protein
MSKEHAPTGPERQAEMPRESHERSQEHGERAKQSPERYNEKEAHQAAENARHEAIKEAILSKEQGREKRTHQADRHNSSHVIVREDRDASFDQTMEHMRRDLPRSLRPFSKFIHSPGVERTSEVLGKTIFRPNAILAGGVTAFVAVLALYFYAKYAGFALQGSETIIAFAIGWVFGMLFDLFKGMFTGRR